MVFQHQKPLIYSVQYYLFTLQNCNRVNMRRCFTFIEAHKPDNIRNTHVVKDRGNENSETFTITYPAFMP